MDGSARTAVLVRLAVGGRQVRDAELGLAPLEDLRHLRGARVVRARVDDHLEVSERAGAVSEARRSD